MMKMGQDSYYRGGLTIARLTVRCQLLCVVVLAIAICTGCISSHVHQTQARELVGAIDDLLVSEKLCRDRNDCTHKQYFFIRPSTVIEITVYGITDRSIAKKIIGLCIDAHAKYPEIRYELEMYTQTKEETLKGEPKTTILQLILKKEK
ncbi:MAG: hypothetical protein RBT11_06255 [Desulfobacterales bacterium]|jgi:hypothetical protein|nr:hypothetical protein [Desulfobacterales bacterium]